MNRHDAQLQAASMMLLAQQVEAATGLHFLPAQRRGPDRGLRKITESAR